MQGTSKKIKKLLRNPWKTYMVSLGDFLKKNHISKYTLRENKSKTIQKTLPHQIINKIYGQTYLKDQNYPQEKKITITTQNNMQIA